MQFPGTDGFQMLCAGTQKPVRTTMHMMFTTTEMTVTTYRKYLCSLVAAWPITRIRKRTTEILPVVVLITEKLGARMVYLKALMRSAGLGMAW